MSLQEVQRNLSAAIRQIGGGTARGVLKAGLFVQRESMLRTPVQYGKLRASAVTTSSTVNGSPITVIAYTAAYAPFVHEILTARHKIGQAKFLEAAVQENANRIVQIIAEDARIR
jgi:type VI protein secretion system component VasA